MIIDISLCFFSFPPNDFWSSYSKPQYNHREFEQENPLLLMHGSYDSKKMTPKIILFDLLPFTSFVYLFVILFFEVNIIQKLCFCLSTLCYVKNEVTNWVTPYSTNFLMLVIYFCHFQRPNMIIYKSNDNHSLTITRSMVLMSTIFPISSNIVSKQYVMYRVQYKCDLYFLRVIYLNKRRIKLIT